MGPHFGIPADLAPRRPRAYLITVGVSAYDNPAFDLRYSANDAHSIQQTVRLLEEAGLKARQPDAPLELWIWRRRLCRI
jgi:hypothetical protein